MKRLIALLLVLAVLAACAPTPTPTPPPGPQPTPPVVRGLVPLKLYWSDARQDNFTTATDIGERSALEAGYGFSRVEGYVYSQPMPGTVPLKLFWSADRQDNFTTATDIGERSALEAGYYFVRIEGYVYPATGAWPPPGTVPLKLFWSADREDNFTTATAIGEQSALGAGYGFSRVEGYVFSSPSGRVAGQTVRIPAAGLAAAIQLAFNGTQVRLHNLGSEQPIGPWYNRHETWHMANASFIHLPALLGGFQTNFDIREFVIDIGAGGYYKYYINDVNLSSIGVQWQSPEFVLALQFEGDGREVKGFHTARGVSLRDDGAPDIQVDEMRVDVRLVPAFRNNSVSYSSVQAVFNARIQATGICNIRGIDLCNELFGYRGWIRQSVEAAILTRLNDDQVRNLLADALRPHIATLARGAGAGDFGTLVGLAIEGDNLVLTYQPH